MWIAGVKIFGFQTQVAPTTLPRAAKQIHVDGSSLNNPWVLNDKGQIYVKLSNTWTLKGDDAKAFSIDPTNAAWKIKISDNLPYVLSSASWLQRGDTEANKIAIGPNWQWITKKSDDEFRRKTGTGNSYLVANDLSG